MVRPGINFDNGDDGLVAQPTRQEVSVRRNINLHRSSSLGLPPSEVFIGESDNASLITEGTWLRLYSSGLSQSHSCMDLTVETPYRLETEHPPPTISRSPETSNVTPASANLSHHYSRADPGERLIQSNSNSPTRQNAAAAIRNEETSSSDHWVLHIQHFDAGNAASEGNGIGQGAESSMEQSPQHFPLYPVTQQTQPGTAHVVVPAPPTPNHQIPAPLVPTSSRYDEEAPSSTQPPPRNTTANNAPTTIRPSVTDFLVEASLVTQKTGKKHTSNTPPLSDAMFCDCSPVLVEAKPMTSSIPLLLRNRRFQCGVLICCVCFTAVILGTIYAVTGFLEFGFADTDHGSSSNPSPSSDAPTYPPTTPGDPELYHFKQAILPSYTQVALQNPESPQAQALEWLLQNENLETLSDARRRQRFVLATLFYSTRGQRWWLQKDGWLDPAIHECEWHSSTKSVRTSHAERTTSICVDEEYRILDLTRNELRGTIPAEIALLTGLTSIVLESNFVSGMIPSHVGGLTNLQTFSVLDNFLSGTLPSALGDMKQLEVLNLGNNLLVQTLPTTVGRLTNLKELAFGDNEFMASSLPSELGLLENLETLWCNGNSHTGTIPTEFSSMSALQDVRFDVNVFEGPLPEMKFWTDLESFNAGNNRLAGSLGKGFWSLANLKYVNIHTNDFTGTLTGLGQLTNAQTLSFENNGFRGLIPSEIGNLSNLTVFWAFDNELKGGLPSEIGMLTALTSLNVSYNSLKGILPTEIGLLTNLGTLFLEENDFEGTVPAAFSSLQKLSMLGLHANRLVGEVPLAVCGLTTAAELRREKFTIDCNEVACNCCTCESEASSGLNW
jgi:Leucine-rich repeat (LRR) protein